MSEVKKVPSALQPDQQSARGGNPRTDPMGTPSAELLALNRVILSARAALKLVMIHAARVSVVGTAPPMTPEDAAPVEFSHENEDGEDVSPGAPRVTADAAALAAMQVATVANNADAELLRMQVYYIPHVEKAQAGKL